MVRKHTFLRIFISTSLLATAPQALAQQVEKLTQQEYEKLAETLTSAQARCKAGKPGSRTEYLAARKAFEARLPEDYQAASPRRLEELKAYRPNSVTDRNLELEREKEAYLRRRYDRQFPLLNNCPPTPPREYREPELTETVYAFFAGFTYLNAPQAGYGVEIVPGAEKFVAETDSSLKGYALEASIIPKDKRWSLGIEYANLDGRSEGQIANGTENVGIVYHDFAPSGSTGIAIGPRGLDVQTETDYHYLEVEAFMKEVLVFLPGFDLGLGARLSETEHKAMVTTPTFSDIRSDSTQKLYDRQIFAIGEVEISLLDDLDEAIGITLTPRVEAGLRNASLESMQHNICGLCGASDQNFIINIDDKDSGFFLGAGITAEAKFEVSENTNIGIRANAWWRNRSGRIFNPETGDDLFIRNQPTYVGTDSITGATIGITLASQW